MVTIQCLKLDVLDVSITKMFVQSDQGVGKLVAGQEFAVAPGVGLMVSLSFSLSAAPENLSVALADDFSPRFQDEADVTYIKGGTYMK